MRKLLILILFTGVLLASIPQIFLQHLRVNGIEAFKISDNNTTLIISQSGPLLKGKLLEEAKNYGIKKVVYFVNNKNKSGYKNYIYLIKNNKLVLKNIVNPFYKEELAVMEANKYRNFIGSTIISKDEISCPTFNQIDFAIQGIKYLHLYSAAFYSGYMSNTDCKNLTEGINLKVIKVKKFKSNYGTKYSMGVLVKLPNGLTTWIAR